MTVCFLHELGPNDLSLGDIISGGVYYVFCDHDQEDVAGWWFSDEDPDKALDPGDWVFTHNMAFGEDPPNHMIEEAYEEFG